MGVTLWSDYMKITQKTLSDNTGLVCKMNIQHRMKKQTPNTEHSTAISVSFQPF